MGVAACAAALLTGCAEADAPGPTQPQPERLFTLAVLADTHISGSLEREQRLAAAVAWINAEAPARAIELVVVLGDIGWAGGTARAKELLDALDMPYVPLVGDNELHGWEEDFAAVFEPQYDALVGQLEDYRRAATPIDNPLAGQPSYLQTFAFSHRGSRFYALDWCIRGEDGVLAEFGDLHDYEGGTWRWFEEDFNAQLAAIEGGERESVILLSHIPMMLGAFDHPEMDALEGLLLPEVDYVYANLAGHVHFDMFSEEPGWDVYTTDATWDDDDTVRLIEVSSDGSERSYLHELVPVPW